MDNRTESNNSNERYILSSVDSALKVLNLFLKYEEMTTTEIARETGMSRSTAFRFIVTLENRGYLYRAENGKYRLGINVFSLGQLAYSRNELVHVIHPYLVRMAEETGETAHVAIIQSETDTVFIDRSLGTQSLKMSTPLGYRMKAHNTATGKAILAFQDEKYINQYLRVATFEKTTEHSIENAAQLLKILDDVRRDGYASDSEEAEEGLTCFARPLINSSGRAYAAISVSGPTTRMLHKKEEILGKLDQIIGEINSSLP